MMDKELIKKRFAKNLNTYNENAKIQKKMAEKLTSYLDNKEYDNILEIGCGTGLLTEAVIKNIKYKSYTANDIVEECEKYIKKINSEIKFIKADIEECIKNSNTKYDLIISNAAFQWVEDLEQLIKTLYSKLNPNGVLLFSTFGIENFREVYFVLGKTLPYFSIKELHELLSIYKPQIDQELHVLSFKTPKDILKHFKLTGVNSLENSVWTKSDLSKFEKSYLNYCSQAPTLTYNPIYVKITNS